MKKVFSIIFLLLNCIFLNGEIFEVNSIYKLRDFIDESDSLIIFDIDNTLMETEQTLGSDQWFYFRMNQLLEEGFAQKEALNRALREWISIQNISNVKVVEEGTSEFVEELQKQNYNIIGLTTRGLEMSFTTIVQLQSLNINLKHSAPFKEDLFFKNGNRGIFYHEGILFTMASSKGEALYKFLTLIEKIPSKIIFINDKKQHLEDVERMCIAKNIPFIGLRYNYLDHKIENFDKTIAEIQFAKYGQCISDDEAINLLNYD